MNREVLVGLGWAAAILVVSLAASWARGQGYIDQDTTLRVVAMNGLVAAYYGNLIPKRVAPSESIRRAMRVSGWSLVLGGILYAGLWAFAPLDVAKIFGTGAMAAGVIVAVGYSLWLRVRSPAASSRR